MGITRTAIQRWFIVLMMLVLLVINDADRAVLGLVAIPLSHALHIDAQQYGELSSGFYVLFSVSTLTVGVWASRARAYWVLGVLALSWALCQVPIGMSTTLGAVLACRVGLGAAEGPASPFAVHAVHGWFGPRRRGVPTAAALMGGSIGVALTAPPLTWLIVHHGWQSPFLALAAASVAWALTWFLTGRHTGPFEKTEPLAAHRTSTLTSAWHTVRSTTFAGIVLAAMAGFWTRSMATTWLPRYLEEDHGLSPTTTAQIVVAPSLIGILAQLFAAFTSDRLARRGAHPRISRGAVLGALTVLPGALLLLHPLLTGTAATILFLIGIGIPNACLTLGSLLLGEISSPEHRAAVLSAGGTLLTLPGFLAPTVMGIAVAHHPTHAGYSQAWTLTGTILLLTGSLAAILIRRDQSYTPQPISEPPIPPQQ